MPAAPISFEASYSPESIREACFAFRDYRARKYGAVMIAACAINVLGLALVVWAGAKVDLALHFMIFVAAVGPLFVLYEHFVGPHKYCFKLGAVLAPAGNVSVGPETITLPGKRGEIVFPWAIVKAVVETPGHFLLILSPFSSYFVPRTGMPAAASDALRSKIRSE